jgi:Tfp pilus assembly protein PilF
LESFEQQRDTMQLQAALDRFNQGDYAGCESRLAALVERRPDFVPARLRLAEILWSRGDAATAEQHYIAVLALQPDLAEAHHGLGTLLETEGRFDEAAEHLARSAELDASLNGEPQATR